MKFYKFFALVLALSLFLSYGAFAQQQGSEEERENMTQEEYDAEITRLTEQKNELQQELNALQSDVDNLTAQSNNLQTYEDCMNELYAMVGATEAEVDQFRMRVNNLNSQVDRKVEPKEDRVAEHNELKQNRISALPEFYNKVHNEMQRKLDAWKVEPKEQQYVVKRGDHLWGISKMDQHYGNPFAWPQIYEANKDKIKDPDLIYPDQEFKIPNLTEEEKEKYNKIFRNWKAAPRQSTTNQNQGM